MCARRLDVMFVCELPFDAQLLYFIRLLSGHACLVHLGEGLRALALTGVAAVQTSSLLALQWLIDHDIQDVRCILVPAKVVRACRLVQDRVWPGKDITCLE